MEPQQQDPKPQKKNVFFFWKNIRNNLEYLGQYEAHY